MNTCPCCAHTLLRHYKAGSLSWFCPYCRQTMPNLTGLVQAQTFSRSSQVFGPTLAVQQLLRQSIHPVARDRLVGESAR